SRGATRLVALLIHSYRSCPTVRRSDESVPWRIGRIRPVASRRRRARNENYNRARRVFSGAADQRWSGGKDLVRVGRGICAARPRSSADFTSHPPISLRRNFERRETSPHTWLRRATFALLAQNSG